MADTTLATTGQGYTGVSGVAGTYFDPTFYDRALLLRFNDPEYPHLWFAEPPVSMGEGAGKICTWHYYAQALPAMSALGEGADPVASTQINVSQINKTLAAYGAYTKITEEVDMYRPDPILSHIAGDVLADQAANTLDQLMREVLLSCANVHTAIAGSNTTGATTSRAKEVTDRDLEEVYARLRGANTKKITEMIKPGPGVGSLSVPASYRGIAHTDLISDFKELTDWLPVHKYPVQTNVLPGEEGMAHGIRWCFSTNAHKPIKPDKITATNVEAEYKVLVFGQKAYGAVKVKDLRNVIKGFNDAGSVLNRYATSGWVHPAWAGVILRDINMVVLKASRNGEIISYT